MTHQEWSNWAGNQRDCARRVRPGSVAEVADAVKRARAEGRTVKPVGAGHSFTNPDVNALNRAGFAYHKESDERSWRAMLDLFEEAFGAP